MRTRRRKSLGYGAYGQSPFQPNFIVCKSEGGTANCPSEYVKEFSGSRLADFIPEFAGLSDLLANRGTLAAGAVFGLGVAIVGEMLFKKPIVNIVTGGLLKSPYIKLRKRRR